LSANSKQLNAVSNCIVCDTPGAESTRIRGEELRAALGKYFGSAVPDEVSIRDYDLATCHACGLGFSVPMIAGEGAFYSWITRQAGYYPAFRWEWGIVLDRIRRMAANQTVSVLDVGCGSGDFLSMFGSIPGVDARGIDTTDSSVRAGRERGLNVVCADMEQYKLENPEIWFDVVTSFHCIEHVGNPKAFLSQIVALLKPDRGVALVSAPLSPMSFETGWFDPLNHPPHHLTRWSLSALKELSKSLGLESSITTSPAGSNIVRALEALELEHQGALNSGRRRRQILGALSDVPGFLREYAVQSRRPKTGGRALGNTFLAAFYHPRI
jgi:SAM-dependent methyltransferase